MVRTDRRSVVRLRLMCGATLLAIQPSIALAQVAPPSPQGQEPAQPKSGTKAAAKKAPSSGSAVTAPAPGTPEAGPQVTDAGQIVITGYRRSLLNSTRAKKDSVAFTDTIFAEDIGKFPDKNLAESLQRIPGVQLTRDPTTGAGQLVSIRALPPAFTQVTIGGNRINPQWSNGGSTGFDGREVPLELFPSELFTRITVRKSASADQPEGGIAGSVDLSNARPFDFKDSVISVSGEAGINGMSHRKNARGTLLVSHRFGNFGILAGLSLAEQHPRTDGWESVGWTTGKLPAGVCTGTCVDNGPNDAVYATVVPGNAGNGLVPGTPVNFAALNPAVTTQQLANALLPRLARPDYFTENYKYGTGLLSLEWRPSDSLHFAIDGMYSKANRFDYQSDMDWIVRNTGPAANSGGGMVPINVHVDPNNVITSATFANAAFFVENRQFQQKMSYASISPNMSWKVTSNLKFDAQLSGNNGDYRVVRPSINVRTLYPTTTTMHGNELAAGGGGLTVNYINDGSTDIPTLIPSEDLSNPNIGWTTDRAQLSIVTRHSRTRSAQANLTWDLGPIQLKAGGSYDWMWRKVTAYDNQAAWEAVFRQVFPDPGTGVEQYLTPLNVPNYFSSINSNLLFPHYVIANMNALEAATNFDQLVKSAQVATPATQAVTQGAILEKYFAGYGMIDGDFNLAGRELKFNAGGRFVHTIQDTTGPVLLNGNLLSLSNGRSYNNFLPAANAVYKLSDHINVRAAASKTITRPVPDSLLPGVSIIDPSVQTVNANNNKLKPYTSTNFDIGGEYYTGGIGYFGISLFHKNMKNFISTVQIMEPFSQLGIPLSALTPIQQSAIANSGGPDQHIVTVNTPTNSPTPLKFDGAEFTWVQPLDFVVKGLGFSAVYTHIKTSGKVALVTGVPSDSYNITGFYEAGPISVHGSYAWRSHVDQSAGAASGILLAAPDRLLARGQFDLSASYELGLFHGSNRLIFNAVNVFNAKIKATNGFTNATDSIWSSGAQFTLGFQAKF